jgi:hypothetical protein
MYIKRNIFSCEVATRFHLSSVKYCRYVTLYICFTGLGNDGRESTADILT